MHKVVLLMGGNTGNVPETFENCISEIRKAGYIIDEVSAIYQSAPWGFKSSFPFLNQVVVVKTNNDAQLILKNLLAIEQDAGRERTGSGYADRSLDIDILFYDSEIIETPELTIPHPRLHVRNFCLVPLLELMPRFVHPVLQKTIFTLAKESPDSGEVKPV